MTKMLAIKSSVQHYICDITQAILSTEMNRYQTSFIPTHISHRLGPDKVTIPIAVDIGVGDYLHCHVTLSDGWGCPSRRGVDSPGILPRKISQQAHSSAIVFQGVENLFIAIRILGDSNRGAG